MGSVTQYAVPSLSGKGLRFMLEVLYGTSIKNMSRDYFHNFRGGNKSLRSCEGNNWTGHTGTSITDGWNFEETDSNATVCSYIDSYITGNGVATGQDGTGDAYSDFFNQSTTLRSALNEKASYYYTHEMGEDDNWINYLSTYPNDSWRDADINNGVIAHESCVNADTWETARCRWRCNINYQLMSKLHGVLLCDANYIIKSEAYSKT